MFKQLYPATLCDAVVVESFDLFPESRTTIIIVDDVNTAASSLNNSYILTLL